VRTTKDDTKVRSRFFAATRATACIWVCVLGCLALLALAGCSGQSKGSNAESSTAPAVGNHMAGVAADVYISEAAIKATPAPWALESPSSAVRSYLDWTSYAYRIAQSKVASATMSGPEGVRVDAYIQFNIEKQRLMDQKLVSLELGKPKVTATSAVVPAKETWTYSYLSTSKGNKLLGGPYTAKYDSSYKLIKTKNGTWIVDSVKAQALTPLK